MKFGKSRRRGYLFDTEVENIFISEYMVPAPGEYVKVYLYALMCAESGEAVSEEKLAKLLMLDPVVVEKAFSYWQERSVLRLNEGPDGQRVVFPSLKEMLFASGQSAAGAAEDQSERHDGELPKDAGEGSPLYDREAAEMYKAIEQIIARPLGGKEPLEICSWMEEFQATPETIVTAYSYCKKMYRKDSAAYVGKVVKDWTLQGLDDVIKIDAYLEQIEQNRMLYKRVFKALGFMRNPTEEEKKIMDRWFSEMNLPIDQVLEACRKTSGISSPNLNYVNKILQGWYKEKNGALPGEPQKITAGVVLKYYDFIRQQEEEAAKVRQTEVYERVPEIRKLDEDIRKTGIEIGRQMLSGNSSGKEEARRLRESVEQRMADKAVLLTEHNFPVDYTEVHRRCSLCGDTGTLPDGRRCSCFEQRMEEAKTWQNSGKSLMKNKK